MASDSGLSECLEIVCVRTRCVNGFVCVLMFVFCVCLTAAVLSGLFANMPVHKYEQECMESKRRRGKPLRGMAGHAGPQQTETESTVFYNYLNVFHRFFLNILN